MDVIDTAPSASKAHSIHKRPPDEESQADEYCPPVVSEAARLAALKALPWHSRPSIVWLLPFILLYALVIGISSAPQDQLIIRIICKAHLGSRGTPILDGVNDEDCNTPAVQALAAVVMSRLASLKSITAIFTIGFYTTQSDVLGRKLLIYLTLVPHLCSQLLIFYMNLPTSTLSTTFLYLNALVGGCLADCTARDRRSLVIGYAMVILAVGFILGPGIGAYIIEVTGDISSALIVSAGSLIGLILYTLVIPESHRLDTKITPSAASGSVRADVMPKNSSPSFIGNVKRFLLGVLDPLLLFLPGRIEPASNACNLPTRYTLVLIVTAYALAQFTGQGTATIFIPYSNLKYGWTTLEDGIYFTVFGVAIFLVYVAIFPAMQFIYDYFTKDRKVAGGSSIGNGALPKHSLSNTTTDLRECTPLLLETVTDDVVAHDYGESGSQHKEVDDTKSFRKDIWFFIFGTALYALGYAIVAVFNTEMILYIAGGVHALGSVAIPSFTSLLTACVPPQQTGKALGGVSVLNAIIATVSSLVYGWIFAKSSQRMPSLVFAFSSVFCLCSCAVTITLWLTSRRAR
ncbi:hypothetical protein BGZ99_002082 [Dissophora globulifera]|uniref:MFS general substrate transporter n=1 Tax=Dissophora globulifera TaxID=979702 RepID=A0A9P6UWJ0_9FUNG|nr:hypothetical protein BGZ99_002082 [Dissophora globulifera]